VVFGILEFGIQVLRLGCGHRVYISLRIFFSTPLNNIPSGRV